MGLTNSSIGTNAIAGDLIINKHSDSDKTVALAGNPNVGKSTVFNGLTGMNQHTGNWPGKTVTNAQGRCSTDKNSYIMVDIPGTYSLMAHSAEEEVARNFICFGNPDAVVVVCDATCLERNLNLVLQTIEISKRVIVCVNLLDEAKRKHITVDLKRLSVELGVPTVGIVARKKKSIKKLLETMDSSIDKATDREPYKVRYPDVIEEAVAVLQPTVEKALPCEIDSRWLSLKLLDDDETLKAEMEKYFGTEALENKELKNAVEKAKNILYNGGVRDNRLKDMIVSAVVVSAERIAKNAVTYQREKYSGSDRRIDRLLTSKWFGYPVMLLMVALIFWITITGANYPSEWLSRGLFYIQDRLSNLFHFLNAPEWLHGALVLGVYRVLAWVVSVMLPPMAIFFPLFTLLEDAGYLPRVAYMLDRPFKCCNACGKQSLSMCMGFGCNAAGVVGCRIIDSPRERLLAILTNNFVPCNGRFPTLIAIITMFFIGTSGSAAKTLLSTLLLTLVIVFAVVMTFLTTFLLSKTVLKGMPSSFTLELPPYRRPQFGKVIVRSVFDRTLFVLGRAAAVAAPAGLVIWLMANVKANNTSLLSLCSGFLDPFARFIGLDGVILMAFILGFPANEIVIPIIIMAYTATGTLNDISDITLLKQVFVDNGWTWLTAVNVIMFSLMHWPCSTTLMTVKKETGSLKWTFAAALIPTAAGIAACFLLTTTARGIGGLL